MRVANKKPRFVTQEPAPAAAGKPLRYSISGNDETVDPNDGKAEETIFSVEKANDLPDTYKSVDIYFDTAGADPNEFKKLVTEWDAATSWEDQVERMLGTKKTQRVGK